MALPALVVGCSSEECSPTTGPHHGAAIVPMATVSTSQPTSRGLSGPVSDSKFPKDTRDVFAVTDYLGDAAPGKDYDVAYFHNQAVSSDSKSDASFNTPQYYPIAGKLYFYAYSPVMPEATDLPSADGYRKGSGDTMPTVTFDISQGNTDILWAADATGIERAGKGEPQPQPKLKFDHRLQQLRFKLTKGADFPASWKVGTITVKGNPKDAGDDANKLKEKAVLNLINGTVTYSSTVDDFSYKLDNPSLWDVDSKVLDKCLLVRPIQRLRLSFVVDTDPANPGQHTRTYSADVTLGKTQTDIGGKNYLLTVTLGGGIDVKIKVMEEDGWKFCLLDPQKIGK